MNQIKQHPILYTVFILLLAVLLAACVPSSGSPEPASPVPTVVIEPAVTATPTVETEATATATATATTAADAAEPAVSDPVLVTQSPTNVRLGPGVAYSVYYVLDAGTTVPILGRNSGSTWWVVPGPGDGSGPAGWIAGAVVSMQGDTGSVPIMATPPLPPTPYPEPGLPIIGSVDSPPASGCVVYQNGRVLDQDLPYVRSGPGLEFGVIGQLGRNRWAHGLRMQDGWFQIVIGPGEAGWVRAMEVGINQYCQGPAPVLPVIVNRGAPANDRCVVAHPGGTARVDVHLRPSAQSAVIAHLGNWADIRQSSDGWYEIVIPQGGSGWVDGSQVGFSVGCELSQPEPTRIEFAPGTSSAAFESQLTGQNQDRYLLWAAAGQTMSVEIVSTTNNVLFHIEGVSDGQVYKHLLDGESSWQGNLSLSQDYLITVDKVGDTATYTLHVSVVDAPDS